MGVTTPSHGFARCPQFEVACTGSNTRALGIWLLNYPVERRRSLRLFQQSSTSRPSRSTTRQPFCLA
jgi:hypothetical protein